MNVSELVIGTANDNSEKKAQTFKSVKMQKMYNISNCVNKSITIGTGFILHIVVQLKLFVCYELYNRV